MNTINGRTPEEIKKELVEAIEEASWVVEGGDAHDLIDAVEKAHASMADALALIQQLECERDAAVRTARWQFEKRSDGSVTELPVCSGCGATPKYYVPMNDVGMQVPPYCHECGSRMAPVVKLEVE